MLQASIPTQTKLLTNETAVALGTLLLFALVGIGNVLFLKIPLSQFLTTTVLYVTLGLGIIVSFHISKGVTTSNFVGQAATFFGIGFSCALVSYLLWDYHLFLPNPITASYGFTADALWFLSLAFSVTGLAMLLDVHKHAMQSRYNYEAVGVFLLLLLISILLFGWPALGVSFGTTLFSIMFMVIDVAILTTVIMVVRIAKQYMQTGLGLYCGGLIALVTANGIVALQTPLLSFSTQIILSNCVTIIAWILMATGTYLIGKQFVAPVK